MKWLDKHLVLNEDHIPGLEASAAQKEFRDGVPREKSESIAYDEYIKHEAIEAAAYHYLGVRVAKHLKLDEIAKKHGEGYAQAMSVAGFDPVGEVPQEVMDRIPMVNVFKFKQHPYDKTIKEILDSKETEEIPNEKPEEPSKED